MSPISRFLFGVLTVCGAVQAYPQQQQQWKSTSATSTAAAAATPAPSQNNDDINAKLALASTTAKALQLLFTQDGQTLLGQDQIDQVAKFDFNDATPKGMGGATKSANADSMPYLFGKALSTTFIHLNPCGMNTTHVHPRADEWLTVVEGKLLSGTFLENGVVEDKKAEITTTLEKFHGTVYPRGQIHYQFNNFCEAATAIATLDNSDAGTEQIAPAFFGLNPEVVNATLGYPKSLNGKSIEDFRKQIPPNLALAMETCLVKCGMQ